MSDIREQHLAIEDTLRQRAGLALGVGFPEGWTRIVEGLHRVLVALDPDYRVDQVKEKFGGLRFYATSTLFPPGDTPFWEAIKLAERASYAICETCGFEGRLRNDLGWARTLCDEHHAERKAQA